MRRLQTRNPGQLALACLVAAVVFIAALLFLKQPQVRLPTAPELLSQAWENLSDRAEYPLAIEEHSPGYRLKFEGKVQNWTEIRGTIPAHCLEVQYKNETLYIKAGDKKNWERVERLQLESLSSFITSPAEIIGSLQENFPRFLVELVELGEESRYKVHFESEQPDPGFIELYFPELGPNVLSKLALEIVLTGPEVLVEQIEVRLEFRDPAHGPLYRIYSLD
ncbi:MAG: hypothetical protein GX973_01045 [Firmicutes bacterium]|nr:hypothetical protein [Bacillota bacterium]